MPSGDKDKNVKKRVRIERTFPDDLQSHFVTNIVIQHQPEYFTLSFFETWPPPILADTEEERRKALDSLEKIEANCVARLVVTPSKMREFVDTINENLANYDKMMQGLIALQEKEQEND